jgi:hypothetical protein
MKEMNENLRSWQPRQPSAGLKRRIFRLVRAHESPAGRWLWSCLAPTMACAAMTLIVFNHEGGGLKSELPIILRNQATAGVAATGEQTQENTLAAVTFDWTNQSVFRSSIRFTPTMNLTN